MKSWVRFGERRSNWAVFVGIPGASEDVVAEFNSSRAALALRDMFNRCDDAELKKLFCLIIQFKSLADPMIV